MNKPFLTALVDVLMLLIVALFTMLAMAKTSEKTADEKSETSAGTVTIQIEWPSDRGGSDVDLWVRAPGDVSVGYSAKNGKVFDLVRDDLGAVNDDSGLNFEIAYSRWSPPGEYIVNVYYYRGDGQGPIQVRVLGNLRKAGDNTTVKLFAETVVLPQEDLQLTVIRFTLDKDGRVLGTNHIPIALVGSL